MLIFFRLLTVLVLYINVFVAYGQLKIGAQLRPRTEYRHGYRTLSEKNETGIILTTQRSRLFAGFEHPSLSSYISFQDVRVWGQDREGVKDGSIGLYEGWFNWSFLNQMALKLGRQEIEYDDAHLIGISDWRLQARSHDAAVLQWRSADSSWTIHTALAINMDREALFKDYYTVDNYKNMQILWANKQWETFQLSLVGLRNGYQLTDSSLAYLTTVGTYLKSTGTIIHVEGSYYFQFGTDQAQRAANAHFFNLNVGKSYGKGRMVTVGVDFLSGTPAAVQQDTSAAKTNGFIPVFARRHRHFGLQDMFYAGGFNVPSGLVDAYLKANHWIADQWSIDLQFHLFNTHTEVVNESSGTIIPNKLLGQEVDLRLSYQALPQLEVELGYSQFFATETMEVLKGGDKEAFSNFAYISFSYQPVFWVGKG